MRERLRAGAAVAATLAAAEGAVVLLRPREGRPPPDPVASASYFSAAELDRARRFRRGQRALGLAGAAIEVALLADAARRPRRWAGPRSSAGRDRPVAASALAGAGLALATDLATLPLGALARRRALTVGLATQGWPGWAGDRAKASALGAGLAAAGSAGTVALQRRAGPRWWLPGAGLALAAAGLGAVVAPLLLEPLFLHFAPLEDEALRADVLGLADAAGVTVGSVLVADASRKTSGANAYVSGLGATRRVVLFDTLLRDFSPEEVRLVVAHELSHVRHRDVLRTLGLLAATVVPAAGAVATATRGLEPGPAALPALALAAGAASVLLGPSAARLSRAVEVRADRDALRLAGGAEAFVAFHRRIAVQNVGEPDPPRWTRLTASHPSTVQRIALALEAADAGAASARDGAAGTARGAA